MKGKNKKLMLSVVIVLVLSIAMATVVFAADYYNKTLNAAFRNIKIFRNGQQVQLNLQKGAMEPFIVDGTTYVPLRAVSEILDKEVSWDQSSYAVHINDKQGQTTSPQVLQLMTQLAEKDAKIKDLEKQVASLQAQLKSQKMDLDDLEYELNKKFDEYEDIEFSIKISGDEDDIKVKIYLDLDDYWTEWHNLTDDDIEDYIKDIVEYIEDNFKDAEISGFIEDDPYNDKLVEFEVNSKGKLVFDFDGTDDDEDLDDLEEDLNDDYGRMYGIDFDIKLSWDSSDDIKVTIKFDDDYFYDLDDDEIEDYLNDIYDDIANYYDDVYVYGSIVDEYYDDEVVEFEFDLDGYLDIDYNY